jgi:hypothetical protein
MTLHAKQYVEKNKQPIFFIENYLQFEDEDF